MQLACDRTWSQRGITSAPNYKTAGTGSTVEKQVVLMFFNCTVETFNQNTPFFSVPPTFSHSSPSLTLATSQRVVHPLSDV